MHCLRINTLSIYLQNISKDINKEDTESIRNTSHVTIHVTCFVILVSLFSLQIIVETDAMPLDIPEIHLPTKICNYTMCKRLPNSTLKLTISRTF